MTDPDQIAESAIRYARSHTTGVIMKGELVEPVAYVLTSPGNPVASVPAHILDGASLTLAIVIDDAAQSLQLLIEPRLIDPDSAAADRWKIYHGSPRHATFTELTITSAKFFGQLVEADRLDLANPLAPIENAICREMNRDRRADLQRICTNHIRLATKRPLLVGVDPHGFDIRAHAGIVRLDAPSVMSNEKDVRAAIESFLRQAAQESGA